MIPNEKVNYLELLNGKECYDGVMQTKYKTIDNEEVYAIYRTGEYSLRVDSFV